jgi:hypothetical protein
MESWMSHPDAAWWAKLRRANAHLETLAKLVEADTHPLVQLVEVSVASEH